MDYTYQEKIAIMRILLDIIHADGRIDARETFFFNKLKDIFELVEDDHKIITDKNSLIALTQIRLMNDDQKAEMARFMSNMIVVDKDINANEVAIFDVVADFCGINVSFEESLSNIQVDMCSKS